MKGGTVRGSKCKVNSVSYLGIALMVIAVLVGCYGVSQGNATRSVDPFSIDIRTASDVTGRTPADVRNITDPVLNNLQQLVEGRTEVAARSNTPVSESAARTSRMRTLDSLADSSLLVKTLEAEWAAVSPKSRNDYEVQSEKLTAGDFKDFLRDAFPKAGSDIWTASGPVLSCSV